MDWPIGYAKIKYQEDGTVEFISAPPFVSVSSELEAEAFPLLKSKGYRLLEEVEYSSLTVTYCRPWLGWVILRGIVLADRGMWRLLGKLYSKRLIHASLPLGVRVRLRNIRPGPGRSND